MCELVKKLTLIYYHIITIIQVNRSLLAIICLQNGNFYAIIRATEEKTDRL